MDHSSRPRPSRAHRIGRLALLPAVALAAALLSGCGRRETAPPGSETPATPASVPAASAASATR
ncbi:hypothetical protein [Azohydromonas aeria]|uniref:hypothetical protein n=1 Tax=Azohydromonas aeria TaxID=2590212 RepID=UPI0012FBD525|nr:hypothetical protein [Azohydromonas aeria]